MSSLQDKIRLRIIPFRFFTKLNMRLPKPIFELFPVSKIGFSFLSSIFYYRSKINVFDVIYKEKCLKFQNIYTFYGVSITVNEINGHSQLFSRAPLI